MHQTPSSLALPRRWLLALILVAGVIVIDIGMLPLVVDLLARLHPLDLAQQGWVVSAEYAGCLLGTVLSALFVQRLSPWKSIALTGVAAVLLNTAAVAAAPLAALLALRFVFGAAWGLTYANALYYLGRMPGADRSYGLVLSLQTVVFGVFALVLPVLSERWGPAVALVSVDGWFVLVAVAALWLRKMPAEVGAAVQAQLGVGEARRGQAALVGQFMLQFAIFALWTFFGPIGAAAGLSEADIGSAASIGLMGGLPGALVASAFGARLGRVPMIVAGSALVLAPVLYMAHGVSTLTGFATALFVLNVGWVLALSYYMAEASANDPQGRLTQWIGVSQIAGSAVAPALVGSLMGERLDIAFMASAVAVSLGAVFCVVASLGALRRFSFPGGGT